MRAITSPKKYKRMALIKIKTKNKRYKGLKNKAFVAFLKKVNNSPIFIPLFYFILSFFFSYYTGFDKNIQFGKQDLELKLKVANKGIFEKQEEE